MKVLLGTTNPSKVKRFENLLSGCNIEFLTLKDLDITEEPDEIGNTPEENAILKAKFYGQSFDVVICNDSGLYFDEPLSIYLINDWNVPTVRFDDWTSFPPPHIHSV